MDREAALLSLAFAGQAEAALVELRDLADDSPDRASAWTSAGIAAAIAGRMEESVAALRRATALAPSDVLASAYLGIVLDACGRGAEAGALLDHEGLICKQPLFDDRDPDELLHFNRILLDHLLTHPTLAWQPTGKATHGGWQTGELLGDGSEIITEFESALRRSLEDIIGQPEEGSVWPLTAWALALGRGGYQEPHIHQAGVVSGVYYVSVPTDAGRTGSLRFPRRLPWLPCGNSGGEPFILHPCAGDVVVFPSNFWHETVPLASDGLRVSIAFDVLRGA